MEIKRKFEMSVVTNRRYIVRQTVPNGQINCHECGAPALTAEQAAGFFAITQRRIFQLVEADAAHFTETELGAAMVCLTSLAAVLEDRARENQSLRLNEKDHTDYRKNGSPKK